MSVRVVLAEDSLIKREGLQQLLAELPTVVAMCDDVDGRREQAREGRTALLAKR